MTKTARPKTSFKWFPGGERVQADRRRHRLLRRVRARRDALRQDRQAADAREASPVRAQ